MEPRKSPVAENFTVDHFAQFLQQIRQNWGPDLIMRVEGSGNRKIDCGSPAIFILPTTCSWNLAIAWPMSCVKPSWRAIPPRLWRVSNEVSNFGSVHALCKAISLYGEHGLTELSIIVYDIGLTELSIIVYDIEYCRPCRIFITSCPHPIPRDPYNQVRPAILSNLLQKLRKIVDCEILWHQRYT